MICVTWIDGTQASLRISFGHRLTIYPLLSKHSKIKLGPHLIERAVILTDGDTIESGALPSVVTDQTARPSFAKGAAVTDPEEDLNLKRSRQRFEAGQIRKALARTGGNRTHAAKLLEISHRALLYKIKDYGIRD